MPLYMYMKLLLCTHVCALNLMPYDLSSACMPYTIQLLLISHLIVILQSTNTRLRSSLFSTHTICLAPTAYQAGYQAHPPSPLLKGARNAFPTLDGE